MAKVELSIVIPFFNEKANIAPVIRQFLVEQNITFEVICVNNGSSDGTEIVLPYLAKQKWLQFIKVVSISENLGYGYGIMQGVKAAQGELIAWTHGDLQTNVSDVFKATKLYRKQREQNTIIKGKRESRSIVASLFSLSMAMIASILLKNFFYEINAQPKLFHRSFLKYLMRAPKDFSLDLFLLHQAKKHNYRIISFPVYFYCRQHGESKWAHSWSSIWKTVFRSLKYIIALSKKAS